MTSLKKALFKKSAGNNKTYFRYSLKAFRAQMRNQLDSTVVEYPDGTRKPLRDAYR